MTVKLNRAQCLSSIGDFPTSYDAMLDHLPPDLIKSFTARQLAQVVDSLWRCAQASKAIHERDIVTEGIVWDADRQRHVELPPY